MKKTILFIGILFILFLYCITSYDFMSKTQNETGEKMSSQNNSIDSFRCGTMDVYKKMVIEDPDFEKRLQELEIFTKNYIKNNKLSDKSVVTIPVVVHVVYKYPQQNISNAVVQSQIDVINKDYRRLNADTINTPAPFKPLGGDAQIEFVLAKRDPLGNPSIGITRTQTSIDTFTTNNYVKYTAQGGHDIWDRDKYLNIWVCNLKGARGYAYFPGSPPAIDGIVIKYTVFGTIGPAVLENAPGRVTTHEIGHWFNVRHVTGDAICGSDSVADTPTQQALNLICPDFPHITCNNGPNGDMFMNYMDLTTEDCANIFTIGQTNRMNAALYGARSSLLTSNGGIPVSGVPIAHFRSDKMIINFGQSINFFDESGGIPTSWQWTFEGGNPSTSNQKNPTVTYPNGGYYSVKLKVTNSYGTDSVNYFNYVRVLGANMLPFSIVYPPTNTLINTYSTDTTKSIFTWTKSSSNPSISYKWKIRKYGTFIEVAYSSNNNGFDSLITLRNSLLDSIAFGFGSSSDTVTCIWRVFAYNGADSLVSQNQSVVYLMRHTVGIKVISSNVPDEYRLFQNYPNPFNPITKIKFDIPSNGFPIKTFGNDKVVLKIYDILGKEIATLVNESALGGHPGTYEVTFDASMLTSGVYFYRITAGDFSETKKMLLLK